MAILPAQIRAARGLLDWTVQILADKVGCSASTISAIETGRSAGSVEIINTIQKVLLEGGIEATIEGGVRPKQIGFLTYRGADEFRLFYDDVYHTANQDGGNICLFNGVPAQLLKFLGKDWYAMHALRMERIKEKINFRVIVSEEEKELVGSKFATYRFFPKNLFNERTLYVYGAKVAFITFETETVYVSVLEQAETAQAVTTLFDIAWDKVARDAK